MTGKKEWVFADGDLPPRGDSEPYGHEALMVLNVTNEAAALSVDLYFEDRAPVREVTLSVPAERVVCFRMDNPLGEQNVVIPPGQYALVLRSSVPVVAVFGRLDRRKDMAYYTVQGFSQ
jgi:hypothetical protein